MIMIRQTQCDPRQQAHFKNVLSRPVVACFAEETDELIDWVAVPFLHIVRSFAFGYQRTRFAPSFSLKIYEFIVPSLSIQCDNLI